MAYDPNLFATITEFMRITLTNEPIIMPLNLSVNIVIYKYIILRSKWPLTWSGEVPCEITELYLFF